MVAVDFLDLGLLGQASRKSNWFTSLTSGPGVVPRSWSFTLLESILGRRISIEIVLYLETLVFF